MSEVKRYDLFGEYDLTIEEIADGDYVKYEDHDRLASNLREQLCLHEESTRLLCEMASLHMRPLWDDDGDVRGVASGANITHKEVIEHLGECGELEDVPMPSGEVAGAWVEKEGA